MAKHGTKLTDEILDFKTVEDFLLIKKEYKQPQKVRFYCSECNEPVTRTVVRITNLLNKNDFNFLCRNCSAIKTSKEKYGCENPSQATSVKNKIKESHLKNNKGEWMSEKQKEAIRKAYKEKGEEIQRKKEETFLKNFGVSNPNKSKEVREKIKQTNLKKWGVTCTLHATGVKEKVIQKNIEKFGFKNAHQNPGIIQKTKETCKKLYGSNSFFSSEWGKEKIKKVFKEKYGVSNPSQVKEIRDKKLKKYKFENESFDSSWELALWIYAKDHNEEIVREPCSFEYEFNNEKHIYYPDFLYKGKIVEIKGPQFFREGGFINPYKNRDKIPDSQIEAKMKCAAENLVEIWSKEKIKKYLKYVKEKYGADYLQNFKSR